MADLLDDLNDLAGSEEEEEVIRVLPTGTRHHLAEGGAGEGGGSSGAGAPTTSSSAAAAAAAGAAAQEDFMDGGEDTEDEEETEAEEEDAEEGGSGGAAKGSRKRRRGEELPVDEALEAELVQQQQSTRGGAGGLASVARLRATARFREHMASVEECLAKGPVVEAVVGVLEEWPEYRLVVGSNALLTALDDELQAVHRHTAECYAPRFPELDRLVPTSREYIRTVAAIGNAPDLTALDLTPFLPSATIMLVTVTGSTTAGKPLPAPALAAVQAATAEWEALAGARERLLHFVETRMGVMAPNVCALLGARVASLLMACAGGLTALSRSPSCNVQVMGSKKRVGRGGLSTIAPGVSAVTRHAGVIWDAPIVQSTPPAFARKCAKVLAGKTVLAARLDAYSSSDAGGGAGGGGGGGGGVRGGAAGEAFRREIEGKIAKWCEAPPPRAHRPLPLPDEGTGKKRRGGRRARAYKEKMGVTEVRKEANRLAVTGGDAGVGDYDASAMGLDRGMLGTGATATGRMRVGKKAAQKGLTGGFGGMKRPKGGAGGGGGGMGGGALTSFAMTSVKGMQLAAGAWTGVAPTAPVARTSAYFDAGGAFTALPGAKKG